MENDETIITYSTPDVAWNQAAALRRWQEVPHQVINTDGGAYQVTPHVLTQENDEGWWQTSPEEIEAALAQSAPLDAESWEGNYGADNRD